MKQKLFTCFLALIASVSAIYASDIEVDGIWYDFNKSNKTATVTYQGDDFSSYYDEYSGSVVIPSSVTYYGTTYSVTSIGGYAFYGCSKLTSVTIPESVTSIGEYAFSNCSSLTSITIPNSVTSIGYDAFYYCTSLTSVTIPNSVTSIGDEAFYKCSSLTSPVYNAHCFAYMPTSYSGAYTIPEGIEQIAGSAFSGCSKLTSVTIPNSVTSIGRSAFYGCSGLTSITIPNSVTSIGRSAFYGCSGLTSITIPNSVTSIGGYAFYGCSSITSIVVDKNNTTYDSRENCNAIIETASHTLIAGCQKTIIPNSVTSIGGYAFYGCSGLTSITIPNSVTSIGDYAFDGCSSLTSVTIGNGVTSIGYSAFEDCSSLTSITIPNSVTSIGYSAFEDCSSLTSVTIPNSVTRIGGSTFSGCSSLTSITIPNSVTRIGGSTFSGCSSLTSITIPNSVTSIGDGAFEDCSYLTSITIPNSVTSIGDGAFEDCSKLTLVTINSNAIVSKDYSYNSNISHIFGSQVTEYIIGDDAKSIGSSAFEDCSSLTSITIPNSVTSIGKYTFYNCSSLTSVTIPNSVTSIGKCAFDGCSSLTSVHITDLAAWCNIDFVDFRANPLNIAHNLYLNGELVKDLVIPNGVTSIGNSAFNGCSSLTSVTFPNGVTSIGNSAFNGCSSLTSVTIPDSVTSIGSGAFYGCSSLASITCEAENPPTVGQYAFDGVSKSIPVYVPCRCVRAYKVASGWSDFTNIQEPLAEYSIEVYVNDTIMGSAQVDYNSFCEGNQISATPNFGYHFVQWSDGNTENPCTLELTQDTILIAEFAQSFSGQCGDSLYWELVDTTLQITGKGEMYDYKPDSAPWKLLVSSIKVLTIAEDVTKIGYDVFDGCTALVTIVWNAKHAADAYNDGQYNYPVFYGICSQITSFNLGENVEYIPSHLCSGMENLTSVTIPNSVTSIGKYAFNGCSSLTSVTIPESVTSIGEYAFSGCSSLTSVTINSDAIVNKQYSSDSNLSHIFGSQVTEYVIGDNVIGIGASAFSGCSKLTSVTIPESVTSIGEYAFSDCSSLTSITIPNSVTSIGYDAFYYCTSLTSVTIPNSVTSIGDEAFYKCSSLTSITIPNSVTSIGKYAFNGCSSLTSVILTALSEEEFCKGQGNSLLYSKGVSCQREIQINGTKVTKFTIPNSVTSIGVYAFSGCSSLTSVTIPNSVTSIGEAAFAYCSALTSIIIPNSVTSIGEYTFYNCYSLTSPVYNAHSFAYMPTSYSGAYTISEGIKQIAGGAFEDCYLLTSVTIPESVTSIGKYTFYNCSSLTSVTIGNSVTSIGEYTFEGCFSLTSVHITDLAAWCNIDFVDFRANPLNIAHNLYLNGELIKDLVIPNGVTSIGNSAFNGCSSLTSVTIPDSVTSIGSGAFYGCSSLTSITCEAENPPTVGSKTFYNVSKSIPVYVPCRCVRAYKAASGWKDFTNIQEPLAEYSIEVYVNDTIMGTAQVNYNTFCEGNQISATPNFGYHFVQWSDGNTENPCTLELTQDTILTAEFVQTFSGQCGDSLYWELVDTTLHITGKGKMYDYKSNTIPWKLLVSSIKSLSGSEGTTSIGDNAFYGCSSLTSVTIPNSVTSIGDYAFDGCNNITSVTWNAKNCNTYNFGSQVTSFEFGNEVEVVPSSLCKGMEKLTSLTIPNSVKTIGTSAFEGCARLGKISLGTGLEEIAANAFAGCTRLYDIYVYATYPPFAEESSFANYNVYVYVPCEYQRDYTLDIVWGKFKFIECIDSEDATTDGNVTVVPGYNDVTITWPTAENADSYSLVINKAGEPFCTLTFNADGQLLNIAFAPSRDGNHHSAQYAAQTVSGYRFTVTGLTEATQYAYNITTKDAANNTIATYSGEFTTMGGITTAVEDILQNTTNVQKLLRNGQLIIVRDGIEYNAMGQEL